MKKYVLLVALILGQFSCRENDCQSGPEYPFYNLKNIKLQTYKVIPNTTSNSFELEPLHHDQKIFFDKLYIRLAGEAQFYAAVKPDWGFTFGNKAYACSPVETVFGYKGTTERIAGLTITSAFDFDADHPAGSSLNDVFQVNFKTPQTYSTEHMMSLPVFLAQTDQQPPLELNFLLSKQPDTGTTQNFNFDYRFTNGEVYSLQTGDIQFE